MKKMILKRRKTVVVFFALLISCLYIFLNRRYILELYLSGDVHQAVVSHKISEIDALLKRGANINREGTGGLGGGTPLVWATSNSDITMIQFLVKNGADVNQKLSNGKTAIMYANEPKIIKTLIDLGAKTPAR